MHITMPMKPISIILKKMTWLKSVTAWVSICVQSSPNVSPNATIKYLWKKFKVTLLPKYLKLLSRLSSCLFLFKSRNSIKSSIAKAVYSTEYIFQFIFRNVTKIVLPQFTIEFVHKSQHCKTAEVFLIYAVSSKVT